MRNRNRRHGTDDVKGTGGRYEIDHTRETDGGFKSDDIKGTDRMYETDDTRETNGWYDTDDMNATDGRTRTFIQMRKKYCYAVGQTT